MKHTFKTEDSWHYFAKGKMKAEVDFTGRIWHLVTPRGRQIFGDEECRRWIEQHGLAAELMDWINQRRVAIVRRQKRLVRHGSAILIKIEED